MIINSFFSKNNTLVSNLNTNTGKNPVTELFYGGDTGTYSRFIFKIDLTRLEELIDMGYMTDISKMTHTLKLTNTSFFDWSLAGNKFLDKNRTSSFDLIVFPILQDWDEGVGYDFIRSGLIHGLNVFSEQPSNWFNSKTLELWAEDGVYSGSTITLGTQHFEDGNENLEIDITNYVNNILSGNTINYGLGIAFPIEYELQITDSPQYVGFFTRHSQTAYEPYVQTIYDSILSDDRLNFQINKNNRLYLYVNSGGNPIDLDDFPTVQILNDSGDQIAYFDSTEVQQQSIGVYYIEFNLSTTITNNCTIFNDVWGDLSLNNIELDPIQLDFNIKTIDNFNVGLPSNTIKNEVIYSLIGINDGESVNRGDLRDINILPKIKYTYGQYEQNLSVNYRLYMKEGNAEITVFNYQPTNTLYGGEKNFKLDTMSLLPSRYYMDLKIIRNGTIEIIKQIIFFDIISETDYRISQ